MPEPTPIRSGNQTPLSTSTTLRVLAFLIVVVPILVPLNILLWRLALGTW